MKRIENPAHMSAEEAARALGIPRDTLCLLLREGRAPDLGIAARLPSGRWRYYFFRRRVEALAGGEVYDADDDE